MHSISKRWLGILINGIISIVLGMVFILVPESSFQMVVRVLGVALVLAGAYLLVNEFVIKSEKSINYFWILEAILNIVIGVVMLLNPDSMLKLIFIFIGSWLVLMGVVKIFLSLRYPSKIKGFQVLLVSGIITLVVGGLLIEYEFIKKLIPTLIGGLVTLSGLIMVAYSFIIKSAKEEIETETEENEQSEISE